MTNPEHATRGRGDSIDERFEDLVSKYEGPLLRYVTRILRDTAAAQDVGSYLPDLELADFAQTEASSIDDFVGRAVLIEFFAYW